MKKVIVLDIKYPILSFSAFKKHILKEQPLLSCPIILFTNANLNTMGCRLI